MPPWPRNSGLKKQHSVEYWMMASLLYDGDGGETREAIRVSDPVIADAFFVPFFSSQSFNTHGHNMTDPDTMIDRQLQIDILKFLRQSEYWQRSGGRDHVIPMHHPNAFRFLREELNASILVVADFGRYPKNLSNLRKDVVAPYVHVVDSFKDDDSSDPFESRPMLLFFQGRTIRKDEGIVRAKLAKILAGYDDVHYEQSYATQGSIKAFSIFFSVKEALEPGYMVEQLRNIPKERWVKMWRRLKSVSHHYEFQNPPKKEDAVNMLWRQVKHKLPGAKLAVHRDRRLKIPDWWGQRR
ncbi:hypothetical protein L1049_006116 [Liquidambar formosana]|uniref:Exostosin GT47 domain-containing protein n=1 Tax=Liquidambar formosana TaxID=63359 RepID=A0AAP0WSZ8_LIQFO